MHMFKRLWCCFIFLSLLGCDDILSDDDETADTSDKPVLTETYETTKIQFKFNFPSDSKIKKTQEFSYDDPDTYSNSASTLVCDAKGERIPFDVFFLKVAPTKWDVYFRRNDEGLDIIKGEIGGLGQYKATLEFDKEGKFIRQQPYMINSVDIKEENVVSSIELDFHTSPSTNLDIPFTSMKLDSNGCK